MSDIAITHTHADGTLTDGTEKGDGAGPVLKRYGFRWMPSIQCFGIRNSRDRAARHVAIEKAAAELREAGHTVNVEIDDTVRDNATVHAAQHERLTERRAALKAKGEKLTREADSLHRASDAMVEHLPMGQPVFPGARGRAHRNLLDRSINTAIKAAHTAQEAERMPDRVTASRRREAYRERPDVTARRVERLEADLRRLDRKLAGLTLHGQGDSAVLREQYEAERAVLVERIEGDRAVVEQARAEGRYGRWHKGNVHRDDQVRTRGGWRRVVRVNAKSVTVESGYSWTDLCRYDEISDVRCSHDDE